MSFFHQFLFLPGRWIGEGRITFSASRDLIRFYTSWWIEKENGGNTRCQQRVEMQGIEEVVNNNFFVYDVSDDLFKIRLENELVGSAEGTGVIDAQTLAWEFRKTDGILEGFEVYELEENGDYMLHAEYSSPEQFRTIVDGRIWKKN